VNGASCGPSASRVRPCSFNALRSQTSRDASRSFGFESTERAQEYASTGMCCASRCESDPQLRSAQRRSAGATG
jgi:hypothetical protein